MSATVEATPKSEPEVSTRYYTRFTPLQRAMHIILLITFLFLAATGLPLRFSAAPWAQGIARIVGGFSAILFIHKLNAFILTVAFLSHVGEVLYKILVKRRWEMLWGPNSMVPNLKDLKDIIGQMKYFLFLGPQPKFDRFTYWQKLDYWGVFWGMAIIGISGWAMWFAPAFGRLLPGSWLNVALLIHGEEALLATGYIFVVHFFNEHLRPDNFPMDVTVFLGSQSEEEFKERHPLEYARMVESGELERRRTQPPTTSAGAVARVFGGVAVGVGIILILLTAQAFVKG